MYDYYLQPTGTYRGVAAGAKSRTVVLDQGSREVVLVNALADAWSLTDVAFEWRDLDGAVVARGDAAVGVVPPTASVRTGLVAAWPENCSATCFLFLTASDDAAATATAGAAAIADDAVAARAAYWLANPALGDEPDYAALGELRRRANGAAALAASCERRGDDVSIAAQIRVGAAVLVDPRLSVLANGEAVWPLFAGGALPTLAKPAARVEQTLTVRLGEDRVTLRLGAFNLPSPIDVSCKLKY